MISILKNCCAVLLTAFVMTSCSKNTDPADVDIFAGTFRGSIAYTDSGTNIQENNGSVFVTKIGTQYNFKFSDNIPALTGIEFERKDDNTMVNIGSSGTGLITINKDKLVIGFARDGKTWTANCNR